jgi:signal transduction histidine kinase
VKRLKILILIFCLALSIPLAYFVLRTYRSLEQEEVAQLRYFAVTIFDQMEEELASLVIKEEGRPIDQYRYNYMAPDQATGSGRLSRSPLSQPPTDRYILGYLQNNPDGSFNSPLVEDDRNISPGSNSVVAQLNEVNKTFNLKRSTVPEGAEIKPAEMVAKREREEVSTFADKYLDLSRSKKQRSYLGQAKKRVEEITPGQALTVAQLDENHKESKARQEPEEQVAAEQDLTPMAADPIAAQPAKDKGVSTEQYRSQAAAPRPLRSPPSSHTDSHIEKLQVEVDPMQAVFINDSQIFIFRRIVINNQIYRQGFIIIVQEFLNHLAKEYFSLQPMAQFASLRLSVVDRGRETTTVLSGAAVQHSNFSLERTFPRPFSFLRATLTCDRIPKSVGRTTLNIMMFVLAFIILIGLFAIYQSARAVVALSERRSRFVSSVTHELKTPLTNIRMYIEMLEQGIAHDHEREQEYFRILGSESSRLSRLINNVLEYSKLEKKQVHLDLQRGTLQEVIQEVKEVMQEKLVQDGFDLKVERREVPPFKYDREAMIQVLINLIDNSMKFGRSSPTRRITIKIWPEAATVKISVSDTGPGIPDSGLKKIFEDFYRVDSELTKTTGGTGIGLALVKKLVAAMGGAVTAKNNDGPGCKITITMPATDAESILR